MDYKDFSMPKYDKKELDRVNAWPFEEARKILQRLGNKVPEKGFVLFETGYGPSGLPHIGTFGEVARTSMVRYAFEQLSDIPTKLYAFSDDMDALRKVPTNVPNQEMLQQYLGHPLSSIPDPFGKYNSFSEHNNNMLQKFLDSYGFNYEFKSSTEMYKSGVFDEKLIRILENYDKIMAIMLPTLGEERRKTYSPIMPISPSTGEVLQVPLLNVNPSKGTIAFKDVDGREVEQSILSGNAKLQWKADWAMRWAAFDVDYEMSGKDLLDSVRLSSKITTKLGGRPPVGLSYELFVDEQGRKISKSIGNGISIDEWLRYANPESLALFMYKKPTSQKKLHFDVIPKHVEEYYQYLGASRTQSDLQSLNNPVRYIHREKDLPNERLPMSYNLLLNLASVANAVSKEELWNYISSYNNALSPENSPALDQIAGYAINYYQDFVKPQKQYRIPTEFEKAVLNEISDGLTVIQTQQQSEKDIETLVYDIGKKHYGQEKLKDYFKMLYETMLGQQEGPRMGTFIAVYGIDKTKTLISKTVRDVSNNNSTVLNQQVINKLKHTR